METQEQINAGERLWRDQELSNTDWIVPLTDHPLHDTGLTYRQTLRDWPTQSSFPATRPTRPDGLSRLRPRE